MDARSIEATLRRLFEQDDHGCAVVYLFGSVARGDCGAGSDVDVSVLLTEEPPRTFDGLGLALEGAIESALGVPTQVVVLNRASADLIHRVLRDGKLILDRDPSARIRFEVLKRNEYFDLLPHLERYRSYRQIADGSSTD